tara:strand:+ start:2915 stop:6802 length:3888 start_codon:yes stop_codon:yes gene_type:complete
MGRIALVVAGTIIGAYFGNPQLGFMLGSVAGGLLFPIQGPTVEGPRLGDKTITSSAYGVGLPIVYGSMRLGGNIIWATEIEEVKVTEKISGKGGMSQTNITYEYFGSFAVSLCEGEADDLLRIWADGKLIYDKTGSGETVGKSNLNFRFYGGSQTQEPDSLIETDKGEGATPAYRGQAYFVVDRLALIDFGNRIPVLTAEVTFAGSVTRPMELLTPLVGGVDSTTPNEIYPDWARNYGWFADYAAGPNEGYLRRFNLTTMVEDKQAVFGYDFHGNAVKAFELTHVLPNSGFVIVRTTSGNSSGVSLINTETMRIVAVFGFNSSSLTSGTTNMVQAVPSHGHYISAGTYDFAVFGTQRNEMTILKVNGSTLSFVHTNDVTPGPTPLQSSNEAMQGFCAGLNAGLYGEGYGLWANNYTPTGDFDINIYKYTVQSWASYDDTFGTRGVDVAHVITLTSADLIPGATFLTDVEPGLIYDATDNTVMFKFRDDAGDGRMAKVDPSTGTLLWVSLDIGSFFNSRNGISYSRVTRGVYAEPKEQITTEVWTINTIDGEVKQITGWPHNNAATTFSFYNGDKGLLWGGVNLSNGAAKWLIDRGTGAGVALDTVISDICTRVGLTPSEINVTELAQHDLPGYLLAQPMSGRAGIQPLQPVYFFDGIESDYVLNFLDKDGKTPAAILVQDDLAVINPQSGEYFQEARIQEVELPTRVTMTYMNPGKDYLQATQSARRILAPIGTMASKNEASLSVAAAIDSSIAKQAAEKILYSAWIERSSYSEQLSWEFIALDPGDIVELTLDDGTFFRQRLITTDIGNGFSMDIKALSEESSQYTSTVVGTDGDSGIVQTIPDFGLTKLQLICAPLLRDLDDNNRLWSGLYFGAGGFGQENWSNAVVYKSDEGTNYYIAGASTAEMQWGSVANSLGVPPTLYAMDEINTLTVFLTSGIALESVTQLELVNGANSAALIHENGDVEVLSFRDVLVNGNGSFTLSGFARGRRGSEVFTSGHGEGDTFIVLNALTLDIIPLTTGELNLERFYRAVGGGTDYESSIIETKSSPLVDLKPYAPTSITAVINASDIDIAWIRRTRVGGELIDGFSAVPLSEDTEEYEIDIMTSSGISATATLDLINQTGSRLNGATITLGDRVYTLENTFTDVADKIDVLGTLALTRDNIVAAINNGVGEGTTYGTGTVPNADWTASAGAGNTMIVTAKVGGASMNGVVTRTTVGILGDIKWSGTETAGGGSDAVVRAITGLVTPDYTYLSADITTDFGGIPATLTLQVYQISAQVGRGFTNEVTLDVQ